MRKATVDETQALKELVACVRLGNVQRFATGTALALRADSPRSRPVPGPSSAPGDVFDAILDPLFDEDVFLRRMKTQPPMPLGDHC